MRHSNSIETSQLGKGKAAKDSSRRRQRVATLLVVLSAVGGCSEGGRISAVQQGSSSGSGTTTSKSIPSRVQVAGRPDVFCADIAKKAAPRLIDLLSTDMATKRTLNPAAPKGQEWDVVKYPGPGFLGTAASVNDAELSIGSVFVAKPSGNKGYTFLTIPQSVFSCEGRDGLSSASLYKEPNENKWQGTLVAQEEPGGYGAFVKVTLLPEGSGDGYGYVCDSPSTTIPNPCVAAYEGIKIVLERSASNITG